MNTPKNYIAFLAVGVFIILLLPIISSQGVPQSLSTSSKGLTIEYPQLFYIKTNTTTKFHYHVFNNSDGLYLTNVTTTCYFHLYNPTGSHLIKSLPIGFDKTTNFDFEITVEGTNFSIPGYYSIILQCNTSTQAGFVAYEITVTNTGKQFTEQQSFLYIFIFTILIFILFGLLYMGLYLPAGNKKDEMTGYVIQVSNLKYLKLVFLGFSYLIALLISYYSWMVTYSYLEMQFMETIFQFIFYTLAVLTLPLFILFAYLTISNLVRDSQIGDYLSRGLHVK